MNVRLSCGHEPYCDISNTSLGERKQAKGKERMERERDVYE
jgi:hypothetical protein